MGTLSSIDIIIVVVVTERVDWSNMASRPITFPALCVSTIMRRNLLFSQAGPNAVAAAVPTTHSRPTTAMLLHLAISFCRLLEPFMSCMLC